MKNADPFRYGRTEGYRLTCFLQTFKRCLERIGFSGSFLNCLVFALEAHPFAVIHEKRDQICKSDLRLN